MANPAKFEDVQARWRPLSEQEQLTATTLLEDAWRMIVRRIPEVQAKIDAAESYFHDVVMVEANAVMRVMKNPDGKRQESIDDYSYIRDRTRSSGELYISDAEWALLLDADEGRGGAFSIDTMPGAEDLAGDPTPVSVAGITPDWLDWS